MKLQEMSEEQFTKYQLKKIKNSFEKIQIEFNKLQHTTQDAILEEHDENYTLNHCIRWGFTACEELLEVK